MQYITKVYNNGTFVEYFESENLTYVAKRLRFNRNWDKININGSEKMRADFDKFNSQTLEKLARGKGE